MADLMTPELWMHVFRQLGPPALILCAGTVCHTWQTLAWEAAIQVIRAAGRFYIGTHGTCLVVVRDRPYEWCYQVYSRSIICTVTPYTEGLIEWTRPQATGPFRWTAGIIPLTGYQQCARCSALYRHEGIQPLPRFSFCGTQCLSIVLDRGLEDSSSSQ